MMDSYGISTGLIGGRFPNALLLIGVSVGWAGRRGIAAHSGVRQRLKKLLSQHPGSDKTGHLCACWSTSKGRGCEAKVKLQTGRVEVLRQVVGEGAILTLLGVVIGIAAALELTRLMSSLLYDVRPTDPAVFVIVSLFLGCVALASSYIPARRASKVDPMVALRHE
jgi:hypothetical protein